MLSCKQVTIIASDYLENNTPLKWQIKMHLMMCANCRRFARHLKITREMSAQVTTKKNTEEVEVVWENLQKRIKQKPHTHE
jgi:hypothetical protein